MKTTLVTVVCVLFSIAAHACPQHGDELVFSDTKIIVPIKGSKITAAYGKLKNGSAKTIKMKIIGAVGFKAAEIHESFESGGKMGMRKIEEFEIPSGESLELKPGGFHVMLFDPTKDMRIGRDIEIKFLKDGKLITENFKVMPRE